MSYRYKKRIVRGHPNADPQGHVYVHVLVAERALGRHLPAGVEVHHVDEDQANNGNGNLVICQDKGYHKLLHVRARVVRAGGDPNTQRICATCGVLKPFSAFNRLASNKSDGLQHRCRVCQSTHYRGYQRPSARSAA